MSRPTKTPVDHPGTFILEELEARGLSQVDLAYILGVSPQQLSPLLTGKAGISPEMAHSLGDAFDMPSEFFANLQKLYDLQRAKPADPGVRTRATWQSVFPIREMIRRHWIEDTDPALLDLQMLRFFERNRIEDVPFVNPEVGIIAHAARKSDYEQTTAMQYVWLYQVRKIGQTINCQPYSEDKLRASLANIRAHMIDPEDLSQIPTILAEAGVRFVLVEALPRSKIDGVCVWSAKQPIIGMTTRLDRLDNFCFVLRHEIEHVLRRHGIEEEFSPIDELDLEEALNPEGVPEEERQANSAASEFCVPQAHLASFIARKSPFISEQDVLAFASRWEINPSVVVGQIQNRTRKFAWLRKYQKSIRENLLDWKYVDGWGRTAPTAL